MLNELAKIIHQNNKAKGFYADGVKRNMGEMLALIHSEVSEALECDRKDKYTYGFLLKSNAAHLVEKEKAAMFEMLAQMGDDDFKKFFADTIKDTFEDELADIIIRVLDIANYKGIDIEAHIHAKMRYNSLRPHKHGKKY